MFIGKARRPYTHQFFGEVTNQITMFFVSSYQNVLYSSVAVADLKYLLQLKYSVHFVDFKPKNRWFENSDLVGDFTKKLVTGKDGMPKYNKKKLKKKINIRHSWKLISDDRCWPKVICFKVNTGFTLKESLSGKRF